MLNSRDQFFQSVYTNCTTKIQRFFFFYHPHSTTWCWWWLCIWVCVRLTRYISTRWRIVKKKSEINNRPKRVKRIKKDPREEKRMNKGRKKAHRQVVCLNSFPLLFHPSSSSFLHLLSLFHEYMFPLLLFFYTSKRVKE